MVVNICYVFFKLLFKRFNIDLFAVSPKLGVRRTNANKIQVKLPHDLSTETGLKSFCKEVDDILSTVPTRSLETPERSLSRKLIFVAFQKIYFFTGDNQIFLKSSHNGWLLPEFFSDFYI
jgi:hypothetical protein